ncbi:hypothetical protein VII00023_16696 [Vibrio ichthyoenteri ATCC 700023]|uniref:DUF2066 domain-containing protein n=1 Tax=Vibrio ichthyoenteri ATCC 700023 TaxID=870968 RepID=F9S3R0_9VIBR|nr:DUF2066 domain-containing protein [Vibrio ichthyoenteri]EGU37769.1 hypothetical protein VII00023_16696 [Vibrio ichthyoenteri ATCC 700023]
MRRLVLFALGLIGFPAMALTNVDLYHTEVVLDQSVEKPDSQARIEGMKEIVVRASGDQEAINNPVVQKALRQNAQYLAQISQGQIAGQSTVKMLFSAPHINALLSQAQLPIWPAQRANVLVWLVEESQSERSIAWEHSDSTLLAQMKQEAQSRGLPLTVPVGDFDDVTGITISDLWGGFAQPVGQSSQRYPADAVLVVRAQGDSLRWTLYDQAPKTIGVTRQAPLSGSNSGVDAADKMINQISDYFAKQGGVVVASESSEAVKVRFTSLDNAIDFFVLERKLQQLSSVASLDILKIQGKEVTFLAHLLTSPQEFEQEVSRIREAIPLPAIVEPILPAVVTEATNVVSATDVNSVEGVVTEQAMTAEQALPVLIEQVSPAVPPEPILMFEWQGGHYVAPVPVEEPQEALDVPLETQALDNV